MVDLVHRYTLTKIGLREAIVQFETYLTTALHEVMSNILRTEEWQTNVTFALMKRAKNTVCAAVHVCFKVVLGGEVF